MRAVRELYDQKKQRLKQRLSSNGKDVEKEIDTHIEDPGLGGRSTGLEIEDEKTEDRESGSDSLGVVKIEDPSRDDDIYPLYTYPDPPGTIGYRSGSYTPNRRSEVSTPTNPISGTWRRCYRASTSSIPSAYIPGS